MSDVWKTISLVGAVVANDERDVARAFRAVLRGRAWRCRRRRPHPRELPSLPRLPSCRQSIRPRDMSTIGCGWTCAVVELLVDRRHLARAVAAIVAEPVNVDAVVGRIGRDLEVDRLPDIGADLGGKALDACIRRRRRRYPIRFRDCPASCSRGRSCSAAALAA